MNAPELSDHGDYFCDGYEDYEANDCDHQDFDGDILTGRAFCYRCGHAWWMSSDEMKAEMQFICEYAEGVAEEHQVSESREG